MSRIEETFRRLKGRGQRALIPFFVVGDPDLTTAEALLYEFGRSGADMIELGVPCPNPHLDGPIIQASHERALRNGVGLREVLRLTRAWSEKTPPLILMSYFAQVRQIAPAPFIEACKKRGIAGVIIPDLPRDRAMPWIRKARRSGLDTIFLVRPQRPWHETRWAIRHSKGFVYYASVQGLTGPRKRLSSNLRKAVEALRRRTKKPIAVGFGISTPQQVRYVSAFADAVIVGSAIVRLIDLNPRRADLLRCVHRLVSAFASATRGD